MNEIKNYTLTLKKGQENGLVISEDIFNESDILLDTFLKAKEAVLGIINRSKLIKRSDSGVNKEKLSYELYGFSQNIVVFSGLRGQGKTSAMISFSNYLSNIGNIKESDSKEKDLNSYRFKVLPPIDPTALEKGQNILTIVLSRLYRYAEDIYMVQPDNDQYGEIKKNRILRKIEECLRDIYTLKNGFDNKDGRGINLLHEIADSNDLKRKFYQLVDDILDYELRFSDVGLKNRFLVLQMDDTDFQVNRGYEILDDIRRYLTIPNLIILMATDMDILRKEIIQKYLRDFEFSIKYEQLKDIKMISNIGVKYINKLIPPLYIAPLPQVYELVRDYYSNVHLKYINNDENYSLIAPESEKLVNSLNMQETILRMIYRKTRLVFAAPSGYLHNIIPTTLRGLSQFMGLLNSMEDLPEDAYGTAAELLGVKIDDWKNVDANVAERIQNNLIVLLDNIKLLEDYFINNWIPTKLGEEDRHNFNKIAEAVPSEWYYLIYNIVSPQISEKNKKSVNGRTIIDKAIIALKDYTNDSKSLERYLFSGAIRIFITIKNNKYVFNKMLKSINDKLNDEGWKKRSQQIDFHFEVNVMQNLFSSDRESYLNRAWELLEEEAGDAVMMGLDNAMIISVVRTLILSNWDIQDKIVKEFDMARSVDLKTIMDSNEKLKMIETLRTIEKRIQRNSKVKSSMRELNDAVLGKQLLLVEDIEESVNIIKEYFDCSNKSKKNCMKKLISCSEKKSELENTGLCNGGFNDLVDKIKDILTEGKNEYIYREEILGIFFRIARVAISNINFLDERFRTENPEFKMLNWDFVKIFDAERFDVMKQE